MKAVDEQARAHTLVSAHQMEGVIMPRGVPASGRAVRQTKLETLRRHADKLRSKLAELDAQTEAHDAERHRLIGRIVEAHAQQNQEFETQLRIVLAGAALNKDERKLLGVATVGRRRKASAAELSGDQPDRGADMT